MGGSIALIVLLALLIIFVAIVLFKAVRIIPQARAGIVERLGKYHATLNPGLHFTVPFIDRVLPLIDLREQVVSFPSQSVITEDNLVVGIDTVVYFQVTNSQAATYEITNYIHAVDELTSATLRNVVGGLNLEETLTSRDQINAELRGVLDSTTGRWGLRVSRVDIKEIKPPMSIQDSMEKQMRAERDRRAAILTAEGQKQSQILTAEGERQAAILSAEGDAKAAILRADGEAQAVHKVFTAIHRANPSQKLLSYQYLQTLPKLAEGSANKLWFVPTELGDALRGIGKVFGDGGSSSIDPLNPFAGGADEEEAAEESATPEDSIVDSPELRITEEDLKADPNRTMVDPDDFEMPASSIDPDAPLEVEPREEPVADARSERRDERKAAVEDKIAEKSETMKRSQSPDDAAPPADGNQPDAGPEASR
ncbi:SPFH/Band 7/PHB domain protein [Rothia sp. AR01]|uniref:SPFH/Band 7/PHB domain protein n=1 Tax=Rothia santali TaxID=2949643 RepID=A0A9X2H7P7_9MICC|nr:SPFH domain-containing protein [Rothia santali]MCP3424589.1 SPFH/Band 7/PHB domain protein [Rothia santali]